MKTTGGVLRFWGIVVLTSLVSGTCLDAQEEKAPLKTSKFSGEGEIMAVNERDGTLTLAVGLKVDPVTLISKAGQPIQVSDLRVGDRVTFEGSLAEERHYSVRWIRVIEPAQKAPAPSTPQ